MTDLRIGDAERERAATDLGEHFAQGRLTADEHADRLDQVWVAKTQAELVPVFRDLPGGTYGFRPAAAARQQVGRTEPSWRRRRFPVPLFAVVPLLIVLTIAFHAQFIFFGLLLFFVLKRGGFRHRGDAGHYAQAGHYGWR